MKKLSIFLVTGSLILYSWLATAQPINVKIYNSTDTFITKFTFLDGGIPKQELNNNIESKTPISMLVDNTVDSFTYEYKDKISDQQTKKKKCSILPSLSAFNSGNTANQTIDLVLEPTGCRIYSVGLEGTCSCLPS